MTDIDIVTASFEAFRRQDAEAASALLDPGFVFTSPQDDHIDKATWLEICFPTAGRFGSFEFLELVETSHGVIVLYEYEVTGDGLYRNAELIRVSDGLMVETQVFFGGKVAG